MDVRGEVAAGFEGVADVFEENFQHRGDTGAACAISVDGVLVVDIWAGETERGPWGPRTRSCLFSVSKGITALCLLMAAERGDLDLDAPVVTYWPEFGVHGKDATTVRQVLAHRAGLFATDSDVSRADLLAWEPVTRALAATRPAWVPGEAFAYHALTVGFLAGEILRRATGLRPAGWLAEHVAGPLGLSMTFGTGPDDLDFCPQLEQLASADPAAMAAAIELMDPRVVRAFTLGGGGVLPAQLFPGSNVPTFLGAEIPAANLVATARDCARLYAAVAGTIDGVHLLGADTLADARRVQSEGTPFLGADEGLRWGTGFMLDCLRRPMLGAGSFGHDGAGGQLAFGNVEHRVGFGYQTVRPGGFPDVRADELCRALATCLGST